MRGEIQITGLPEADPTALVITGGRMTTTETIRTEIIRTTGETRATMPTSATTTTSSTSTETIPEREEVHLRTEILNQDQTTDRGLGTDTGHTAMTVTTGTLLKTEGETEEILPPTTLEEGNRVTTMTGLHNTDGSLVAQHQDTTMKEETTVAALDLIGEDLTDREAEIPDSHLQEVDNSHRERDLNLVEEEIMTSSAEDVEELATLLTSVRCTPIGEGHRAIAVCFTREETATVPLDPSSLRWQEKMEDKTGTMMLRICISIDMTSLRKVVSV